MSPSMRPRRSSRTDHKTLTGRGLAAKARDTVEDKKNKPGRAPMEFGVGIASLAVSGSYSGCYGFFCAAGPLFFGLRDLRRRQSLRLSLHGARGQGNVDVGAAHRLDRGKRRRPSVSEISGVREVSRVSGCRINSFPLVEKGVFGPIGRSIFPGGPLFFGLRNRPFAARPRNGIRANPRLKFLRSVHDPIHIAQKKLQSSCKN